MRDWKPVLVPLDRGMGQDSANTADGISFDRAINVDFGKRGAVRGRPGYVRPSGGFVVAGQDGTGLQPVPTFSTKATLAATGYTAQDIFTVIDKRSERAGLITNGRTFTQEADGTWVDRYGAAAYRVDRVADFQKNLAGGLPASFNPPVIGYDFGSCDVYQRTDILSSTGNLDVSIQGPDHGPGSSAVCGTVSVTVHVPVGTNNLVLTLHTAGARTISTFTLATDAATPNGAGNNPIVCSDNGLSGFYVAYVTTTAHTVKILSLDVTGTLLTFQTVTYGTGTITNLWVCNSGATTKVILAMIDSATSGVKTKVYSANLIDQALDVTLHGTEPCVQVVIGAADVSANRVWYALVNNAGGGGNLRIGIRSLTAATSSPYHVYGGFYYATTGTASQQGHGFFLQHQPIIFNGRVLFGLAAIRAWSAIQGGSQTATWYVLDLTDLSQGGTTTGARWQPVMVARGTLDASLIPWQPATAMLAQDGSSYRFATADWTQFGAGLTNITAITGYSAVYGLNEITAQAPQVAHIGETTVIGGSIPRAISGGAVYDLGFHFLGFPAANFAVSGTGGSWPAGSYTMQAVWAWTDDAGQVHRSAPSLGYTASVSAGQNITFFASGCMFTDKTLINAGDRGGVTIEFYMTEANPAVGAPKYLVATIIAGSADAAGWLNSGVKAGGPAASGAVDTTALSLYTDGGVLANLPIQADGGVVTVGRRCWVSDGDYLYASKLGLDADPPAWNGEQDARSGGANGPLTVVMPHGAGRILALSSVDEKVVALCERGVYVVAGSGPDDTGANSDYTDPLLVSETGVIGSRAVCRTPRGVIWQAAHPQLGDSVVGGLWILDKTGQAALVSWPVRDAVDTTTPGRMTYIPERGLVVYLVPQVIGNSSYVGASGGGLGTLTLSLPYLVVWDLHVNAWTIWTAPPDGLTSVAAVSGHLWSVGADAGGFTALPGTGHDSAGGVNTNFTMELQTNDMAATGEDKLGWSRVRSLRVLGDVATVSHDLKISYTQDDAVSTNSNLTATKTQTLPANQTQTTGWPSDRYAPEWRIPHQKCSTIQVDIQATPAVATWTALELQVKPERRAPAHFRA